MIKEFAREITGKINTLAEGVEMYNKIHSDKKIINKESFLEIAKSMESVDFAKIMLNSEIGYDCREDFIFCYYRDGKISSFYIPNIDTCDSDLLDTIVYNVEKTLNEKISEKMIEFVMNEINK